MTRRRPLIAAVAIAAALAPTAAAQSPQPTLAFDRPCHTTELPLAFSGSGYTPSGPVDLLFSVPEGPRGSYAGVADASGAIAGAVSVRDDGVLLLPNEARRELAVTATDRTRADAGAQPPESRFGATQITYTRWNGFSPGRYVPGRRVRVEAYGWAFAAGKPLYFLFQRHGRTVASVKAGTLAPPCGDRVARIRVPRALMPGAYRLVLSTGARRPGAVYTWRTGRVVKRASAAATAVRAPMRRAG
jgi:hypothetical protein